MRAGSYQTDMLQTKKMGEREQKNISIPKIKGGKGVKKVQQVEQQTLTNS